MTEAWFWGRVRDAFNRRGGARLNKLPADGFAGAGIPDGLYCVDGAAGVIELKYVPRWPARESTPIRTGLTPAQVAWMSDWKRAGGRAHVLLGVASEWFLLDVPADHDARLSRLELDDCRRRGRSGAMHHLGSLPALLYDIQRTT